MARTVVRRRSALCIAAATACFVLPAVAAELQSRTLDAYETYVAEAKEAFVKRVDHDRSGLAILSPSRPISAPATATSPGHGQVAKVPGGLVHHWNSVTFIERVTLDDVLAVAQGYDHYTDIHKAVVASRLLGRDGDTMRVYTRIKADAGMISTVLDLTSDVTYQRFHGFAYSFGRTREIRQVKNAGRPDKQHVLSGDDGGYLWRANTFTRFVERNGGVHLELETIGLSRPFPKLLGWMLEPIARKLGRASVERTLDEFRKAVLRTTA